MWGLIIIVYWFAFGFTYTECKNSKTLPLDGGGGAKNMCSLKHFGKSLIRETHVQGIFSNKSS